MKENGEGKLVTGVEGGRRNFLKAAAAATAGLAATGAGTDKGTPSIPKGPEVNRAKMPMIRLDDKRVSRLIMGANPHWGGSHRGRLLGRMMYDWYTPDRILETLHHAEHCGISAWQTSIHLHLPEIWKRYKAAGGTMDLIILVHPFRKFNLVGEPTWDTGAREQVLDLKPIALVQHGTVTDDLWKEGRLAEVREIIKRHRDEGLLVGCSSHQPEVIRQIAEENWDIDFFMTCFYQLTKWAEDWKREHGFRPMHEMYTDCMPDKMTAIVRQVSKPCLGFKILAAGRIDRQPAIEEAYQYALQNIKETDGVIVGMFPKFSDQIAEGANYVIKYG